MIGKMMKNAIALIAIAGSTTMMNISVNAPSKPVTKIAAPKKIAPEIAVPMTVNTVPAATERAALRSATTATKNSKPVTNLSIMFGTKPAGNVVNKPDNTPVVNDKRNVSRSVVNNKIPINIIVNIKSGFMPLIGGINK